MLSRWYLLPYYYAGIKAYDIVSGRQLLRWSYVISKNKALDLFPMLKKEKMVGAIVYYDGQHNDARMNIALAFTAAHMGANVANHCAVTEFIHEHVQQTNNDGQAETKKIIRGVKCIDRYRSKNMRDNAQIVSTQFNIVSDIFR
jgi:glycerol-3-phosphate dehydrogenase